MTINYGKRRAGALTAASPGETLYIPFETFNDSGASIAKVGFAVTDIEIFKNGGLVPRATDSGYSVISDSGQYADRAGLHRFSITLYNTADDTGFFDNGSQYHVAIDSITVDGRTVRFFPAIFEIGEPRANVIQIDGDTGPADNLGRIAGDTGTGSYIYRESDTGGIADAIWAKDSRTLTAFIFDTGVAQTVWRSSTSGFTSDTGSVGYAQGRLMAVKGDTGAAHLDAGRLGVSATATLDTGAINNAIWNGNVSAHVADTGSFGYAQGRLLAVRGDTGAAHLDAGRLGVSASATVDTGVVVNAIWNATVSAHVADTGSFGYTAGRLLAVKGDTGAAHLDGGRLGVSATATLDTGAINQAVWQGNSSRTLTAFAFDTGIWGSNFASGRTLTAFLFDTGIAQTVWRSSTSGFTSDTGSVGYAQGRLMAVRNDTGAAHLDQGRLGVISDSGRQAAVLDTGKVAAAVWTSHATRALTAFAFDTGIWGSNFASGRTLTAFLFDTGVADTVWKYTDTGARRVNAKQISGDTGAAIHLAQAFAAQNTNSDTGLIANAAAVRVQTDKLTFDTGANELHADIRKVNNIQIQGAGDTGTANTWRPV